MPIDIVIGPDDPEFDIYKTREAEVKAAAGSARSGKKKEVVNLPVHVADSDDDDDASSFCFPMRKSSKATTGSSGKSSGKSSRRHSKGSVVSAAGGSHRRRSSAKSIGGLMEIAAVATVSGTMTTETEAGGFDIKSSRKSSIGTGSACRTPKSQCSTPGSTKSGTPRFKFFSALSAALPLPTPGVPDPAQAAPAAAGTDSAAAKAAHEPPALIPSGSTGSIGKECASKSSPKSKSELFMRLSFSGSHILTPDRRKFIAQERMAWEGTPDDS